MTFMHIGRTSGYFTHPSFNCRGRFGVQEGSYNSDGAIRFYKLFSFEGFKDSEEMLLCF